MSKMKAMVLEGLKKPLQLREIAIPVPSEGEVLVQLKAAALNHRDVWIQLGQYAGIKTPIILGSDGAGIVYAVGPGVDKKHIGKEVIINPGHNWLKSDKGQAKDFKILGMPDNGTFAEYVKVEVEYIYPKPKNLTFEEAACLPLAGLTAYRALFSRAKIEKNEKVLITGIGGGVALLALQLASAYGAKVFVTSSSDTKIKKAKKLGAIGGVNYNNESWMRDTQALSGGFDVILDSATGENFTKLVELANVGGRITLYGGTKGNIKDLSPQRIFWKQLTILGSTMGNQKEFESMIKFVKDKKIKPVIDKVYKLEDTEKAMRRMHNAEQFGKIVIAF